LGQLTGANAFSAPNPPQQQQQRLQVMPGMEEPSAPMYNQRVLDEYGRYLESEPNREDFKRGKFGKILDIAGAGLVGYQQGPAAGIEYGERMARRPYDEAYEKWANRGNKIAKQVELENARYKIKSDEFSRGVDDRRLERQFQLSVRKQEADEAKARDAGWTFEDGPNGSRVAMKIVNGEPQRIDTGNPNRNLSAEEQRQQFATRLGVDIWKWNTPSANTVYSGNVSRANNAASNATSTANTAATINAAGQRQQAGFKNTNEQNALYKEPVTAGPRATEQTTPQMFIKNTYKDFDRPEFIEFTGTGNQRKINVKEAAIKDYIRRVSQTNPRAAIKLMEDYTAMKSGLQTRWGM